LLSVERFAEADFTGFRETVGGLEGLGMVAIGPSLTIAVAGSDEVRFDGALVGNGDVIVDSPGSGVVRFDATAESIDDKSEKTYSGQTLLRRGSLAVTTAAVPLATSGVEVQSLGRLILATDGGDYIFGSGGSTAVTLAGGRLEQAPGTSVTLANTLAVTADSRILIATTPHPDPLAPTTEQLTLSGPLTGPSGATLTIAASTTTPGEDEARVNFVNVAGNTFAGSVSPEVNAIARFQGNYRGTSVNLAGGRVEGWGELQAISGVGTVSPAGTATGQGVLTAESLTVASDTSFVFGFTRTDLEPNWSLPESSDNDALRLTGSTPLPVALGSGNVVQLFLQVGELVEDDAFYGGFLTRTDTTALITGASFETYVLGDGKGSDAFHDNRGFYALSAFNALKGSELVASVTMTAVNAPFVGGVKENGFLMTATYVPDTGPIVIDVPAGVETQTEAGRPLLEGGRGVIKTGAGTLVIDQVNTHTGTTTVQAGTLRLDNAAGLQASPIFVGGGTLEINVDASLRSLVVDGGAAVLAAGGRVVDVESLAVAPGSGGGLLDLGLGRLNVASGGISAADLRAGIIAGRNGGAWDGLEGFTSGVAVADRDIGVGYVIDESGAASVAAAAYGDTNLDGLVNFDDILAIFPSYGRQGTFVWQQGDFTYDGKVDFNDILAMFPNYSTDDDGGNGSVNGIVGGSSAAVPEPSAAVTAILGIAMLAAMFRRLRL
jgi:autotransporter-associated beta strand protein